ncbi:predicted protein [Naegleria gruberi]|uniref:Predicted protein n=1 Tax=Naegleria gruberi TaxID=5762 RepID=D2V777_NAEGR|nr:uncharacterized protein NAEGRDRAFT_47219 [Naegleria gruberi]EFC47325.1 predicted protein [Naegleria gruberi]|eukprot:XP_002680069.1 predicted protein [Naegleria gruberi strain NEG-M]
MTRKRSSTNKSNHQIQTSEIGFANSESLLSEDDSPIPVTTHVSQSRNQLLMERHDVDEEHITIQTDQPPSPIINNQQRTNTKSPIARIFHALSSSYNNNNHNTTTTIIMENRNDDSEEEGTIILDGANHHHHRHRNNNQRLKPVEWHNFENIIANDILMIISEFLDDSLTMVNLSHTCSMWYNFLDREQRFWNRLYQIKIRELKLLYFKDFDIYVQEKVVKRRILAVKNYFFNRKKGGNLGQYHLNYLMSNGKKVNTKPSLLDLGGVCKIENSCFSPPKIMEFIEDIESPRGERNHQEVISIEMDEFSNNSGASQTALIDHQLSETLTSEEYVSEEEEMEILTLINESDCDSEESTVQIPPSMFKKVETFSEETWNCAQE